MKHLIATTAIFAAHVAWAQVEGSESLIQASFEGMFEASAPTAIANKVSEPNPPVPLDGGVILLLAGGVLIARKRHKS
jgi:hypothetical protein